MNNTRSGRLAGWPGIAPMVHCRTGGKTVMGMAAKISVAVEQFPRQMAQAALDIDMQRQIGMLRSQRRQPTLGGAVQPLVQPTTQSAQIQLAGAVVLLDFGDKSLDVGLRQGTLAEQLS